MVSAISGLPAIVIESFSAIEARIDLDSRKTPVVYARDMDINSAGNFNTGKSNKIEENKVNYNDLADKFQDILKDANLAIEFSMDKDLKRMIMKLIDSETNEVVRQLPPDITLKIARIVAGAMGNGSVADAKV
ncbi:MAG: flagellar protein FlaG [Desulfobulbaceae bacterium]|nr:flagellar protein FlaG [Ignavibacteria bacterium]MBS4001069.1 flagellar protein FlaG [Desulfobulbaceae bacterium]